MMKFFRKHKKAVSPVIAVMLLVAVAVAAVGAYFIWFRSFQVQTQKSVQETSSGALGQGLQVISFTDDGSKYYVVVKNTLNSGSITVDASCDVSPAYLTGGATGATYPRGGTCTVAANYGGTGTTALMPGATATLTLTPVVLSTPLPAETNAWTLKTGTTRTFTLTGNTQQFVVTTTYTDS